MAILRTVLAAMLLAGVAMTASAERKARVTIQPAAPSRGGGGSGERTGGGRGAGGSERGGRRNDPGQTRGQVGGGERRQRTGVIRNSGVVRDMESRRRVEIVPNRTYWHHSNGVRYSHYYDGRAHWYGFYRGPQFYWTRYHGGWWWWHDPAYSRWVYWSGGNWWWMGPGGVAYIYVNNRYEPYDQDDDDGPEQPNVAPPSEAEKAPPVPASLSYKSPDGTRLIQVDGDDGEAFLYDSSGKSPQYLKLLGKNTEKVRYFGGKEGEPLRILVDFKDGTYSLVDKDGAPVDKTPAAK